MAILDSLIRRKRLLLTEAARDLHEALAAKDRAAQSLAAAEGEHRESQDYLTHLLTSDEPLCVQRLAAAKAGENRTDRLLIQARAAYRESMHAAERLEQHCARLNKDIEKLGEKRVDRRQEAHAQALAAEEYRLDEWVTARHGSQNASLERPADD
jgi:hypothetical protein